MKRTNFGLCAIGLLSVCLGAPGLLLAQAVVNGKLLDSTRNPVVTAKVTVESELPGSSKELISDGEGSFTLNLSQAGRYYLSVNIVGFYELKRRPVDLVAGVNVITIDLIPIEDNSYSIDVYPEKNIEIEQIASSYDLSDDDILSIPAARSYYLSNMMSVMPGVVQDSSGGLHFNGSSAEQTNWLLDGFNLADPVTGQLEATLSVEAVKSLELFSGRYSVEFGKGTGGTMAINSPLGSNRFHPTVTNFVPGFEYSNGLRLTSWRPRFNFSGPLKKDRVWFYNGLDFNYRQNIIPELPPGQDRTLTWILSNLVRVQANLSPSNILTGDFLYNYLNAPKTGLSPLDPVETTLDKRARRYFFNIKDQIYLSSKTLIELGASSYHSFNRGVPQGHELYQITPNGRDGNNFIDSTLKGSRHQGLVNIFLPPVSGWGTHQIKTGLDFNYSGYDQDVMRTGYEYIRLDGTVSKRVTFGGNGEFTKSNLESAAYFQDRWTVRSWLLVEAGIRWDRDQILADNDVTPRFSFSFLPPRLKNTKLSAGFGLIPSATNLHLFTRNLDQYSLTELFGADGTTPVGIPTVTQYEILPRLLTIPKIRSLSFGVEQSILTDYRLQINYLRKRGHSGYTYQPQIQPGHSSANPGVPTQVYSLQNSRTELYDAVEFSLSKRFRRNSEWSASYTRSRAKSNAAVEVSIDDTLTYTSREGPPPWDVPNRLVSWFFFPVTKNNWLQYYLEWRDGFPFTLNDSEGQQVGPLDTNRLPRFFSLNLHYERKFALVGRDWAIRLGADNITDHANYSLVNSNVDSPDFLHFYGNDPRKFVIRIRFLGKSQT